MNAYLMFLIFVFYKNLEKSLIVKHFNIFYKYNIMSAINKCYVNNYKIILNKNWAKNKEFIF